MISITGGILSEVGAITGNTIATIFTAAKGRTLIASIMVTPTSGTPNLSISRYDGTTRTYLRKAVAMTAGTSFIWNEPFVVDANGTLEITSSAVGGDMDWMITYASNVAPAAARLTT